MSEIERLARLLIEQRANLKTIRDSLSEYRRVQPYVDRAMAIMQIDEGEACYAIGLTMHQLEEAVRKDHP